MSKIERAPSMGVQRHLPSKPRVELALSLKPDSLALSHRDGARPRSDTPTAECNDGTVSYSLHHAGTCSGHEGVSQWLSGPVAPPVVDPVAPPVVDPVAPPVDYPVAPPVVDPVAPPVVDPVAPPVDYPVAPPVVDPVAPPVVDPVAPPYVNPVPPAVNPVPAPHIPRYFWMPTYPEILPTEPRNLPRIALPQIPSGPQQINPNSVTRDPFELVASQGRLRTSTTVDPVSILADKGQIYGPATGWWVFKSHHQLKAQDAQGMLSQGQTVYFNDGNGYQAITSASQLMPYVQNAAHPQVSASEGKSLLQQGKPVFLESNGSFKAIKGAPDLEPAAQQIRSDKLQSLQDQANSAYQAQVSAANDQDIQNRENALPAFNSIYNMEGLNMSNMMVTENGRNFNRNLITAMNIYNRSDIRQEIAQRWHDNPNMTTGEFNQMANSVITQKAAQLYWNANWDSGSWGLYLGQQAVPGLRYPDTQQDVDWNTRTIQQVTSQLPMLLDSNVLR